MGSFGLQITTGIVAAVLAVAALGQASKVFAPLAAAIFIIALFPIARSWDRMFTDEELARRMENRVELVELHAIALKCDGPFLAPWWFSPALSYWSRQPGVGGSSHESIEGVIESAKFFGTQSAEEVAQIFKKRNVRWIVAYDADRVARNSSQILEHPISPGAFCFLLDRRPSEAPPFLRPLAAFFSPTPRSAP